MISQKGLLHQDHQQTCTSVCLLGWTLFDPEVQVVITMYCIVVSLSASKDFWMINLNLTQVIQLWLIFLNYFLYCLNDGQLWQLLSQGQ